MPSNSRFITGEPIGKWPSLSAVFLDRDGVIVKDVNFLTKTSDLQLLSGVPGAIRRFQASFCTIVVTNQSGIARGMLSEDDLLQIHDELVKRLAADGAVIDAIYYCPHLPNTEIDRYRRECDCRKPKPGMIIRAGKEWSISLADSFMVGDSQRDVDAGIRAGVKSILLTKADQTTSHHQASDLVEVAALVLGDNRDAKELTRGQHQT